MRCFSQRARRKAEISGCFGSPQYRAQAGVRIRHLRAPWSSGGWRNRRRGRRTPWRRSLKGGCRRLRGYVFRHPCGSSHFLPPKVGAIARDTRPAYGEAVLDQADNSGYADHALSRSGPKPAPCEQAFGNFTITMSLQPRVEGADRQNEALRRWRGSARGEWADTAFNRRQKAMCPPQTNIKISVET